MSISREQLTQIIQEELSEVLGEAVGPTGRPYVRQTPSSLDPLIKNPVAGRGAAVQPPVQPPVVRPPPPVNPPAVTTKPFVDPRIGTQKPFPTSPRVGAPGQYPLTQYAPKAPTNPNWTYGRGTGTGFRAPASYPLARTGPTALSRVTSAAGGTTPHPIAGTQVVGGGLRGAVSALSRAAMGAALPIYTGYQVGAGAMRGALGHGMDSPELQARAEGDASAYLGGMFRSDMTGDEALAMNQALRKMTVPGSAPNSPGGMWSPAQGHAFVNSVKDPKMKETYMQALKDGTYQNLYMAPAAGYGGSREEWMNAAPPYSMAGMLAPQDVQAPATPAAQYDIVAGDTMGEIAKMHGTDVQTLLQLNPEIAALDPRGNLIRVGQKVNLPTGTGAQTGVARPRRWSGRAAAALDKRKESTPTDSGTSFKDIEAMSLDTPMTRKERIAANRYQMQSDATQRGASSKEISRIGKRGQRFNPLKPKTWVDQ